MDVIVTARSSWPAWNAAGELPAAPLVATPPARPAAPKAPAAIFARGAAGILGQEGGGGDTIASERTAPAPCREKTAPATAQWARCGIWHAKMDLVTIVKSRQI